MRWLARVVGSGLTWAALVTMSGPATGQADIDLFPGATRGLGFSVQVVADLDLDGRPDLLAGGSDGLTLRHGRTDRTFAGPEHYDAFPNALTVGDVTGDGWPDVLGWSGIGQVSVLPSLGQGRFGAAIVSDVAPPTGTFARMAVGDLSGDGLADLALYSPGLIPTGHAVRLLRGHGDGTFAAWSSLDLGGFPIRFEIRDLTGDGRLDLFGLVSAQASNRLVVAPSLGDGGFGPLVTTFAPDAVLDVVLADFDGDGLDDAGYAGIVFSTIVTSLAVMRNDGTGAFEPLGAVTLPHHTAATVAAADGDADGAIDLYASLTAAQSEGKLRLVRVPGLGAAGLGEPLVQELDAVWDRLWPVDLDGDAMLDLVGTDLYGATLLHGSAGAVVEASRALDVGGPQTDVAAGDLDGDGRGDLLVATLGGPVLSFLGHGDGTFGPPVAVPGVSRAVRMLRGDLTNDGLPDLVVATSSAGPTLHVLAARAAGTFGPPHDADVGAVADMALADLDGDGLVDVVTADADQHRVVVTRGGGGGTLLAPVAWPVPGAPAGLDVADVHGDGRPDVVVALGDGTQVLVLAGTGGGTLGAPAAWTVEAQPQDVLLADADGDGLRDLYVTSLGATLSLRRNLGAGRFGAPVVLDAALDGRRLEAADLNADGRPDVLVTPALAQGFLPRQVAFALGGPDGTPRELVRLAVPALPVAVVAGDLDADGVPDLAVAHAAGVHASVLLDRSTTWQTLGWAAGTKGEVPLLAGVGEPAAGQPVALSLTHAPSAAPALLVVGLDAAFTPLGAGWFVPSADLSLPIVPDQPLQGTWPTGIAPGTLLYLQTMQPAAAGVATSNALVVRAH